MTGKAKANWHWLAQSCIALCGCLTQIEPAWASAPSAESAQLAAIVRQLDTIDRLATQSEQLSVSSDTHAHFDYTRLHADIARVRDGIHDYLSPRRPLPRDPADLVGQYRVRTP